MFHADPRQFLVLPPETIGEPRSTALSEVLSAFTYALDLTEGQPAGHSLRCCLIAMHIASGLGLDPVARRDVYYAVMLKDLGCSSNAARIAELYQTDDRGFKRDFKLVGADLQSTLKFVVNQTGRGKGIGARARAIAHILRNGSEIAHQLIETRCTRGADIARKLRFSDQVAEAIAGLDEHWDGGGKPRGLARTDIHLGSRIALLAQVIDVFFQHGGPQAALAEVAARRGTWFDPDLCDIFTHQARRGAIWDALARPDLEARVIALEPESAMVPVDEDYLDDIAEAFGQVIDAKSPYTSGHSMRVGDYCDALANALGVDVRQRRVLRRAAILHDVGKLGVSSAILEKPGKLEADEWHVMQNHAHQTTEILGRISVLRDMALIAGSHHERLDGTGYPLGLDARSISLETRIITACDFYDALTADRPYRAAMPYEKALSIMESEVGKAVDADCFAALSSLVRAGLRPDGLPRLPDAFR